MHRYARKRTKHLLCTIRVCLKPPTLSITPLIKKEVKTTISNANEEGERKANA
jgi:hypothetical protein